MLILEGIRIQGHKTMRFIDSLLRKIVFYILKKSIDIIIMRLDFAVCHLVGRSKF